MQRLPDDFGDRLAEALLVAEARGEGDLALGTYEELQLDFPLVEEAGLRAMLAVVTSSNSTSGPSLLPTLRMIEGLLYVIEESSGEDLSQLARRVLLEGTVLPLFRLIADRQEREVGQLLQLYHASFSQSPSHSEEEEDASTSPPPDQAGVREEEASGSDSDWEDYSITRPNVSPSGMTELTHTLELSVSAMTKAAHLIGQLSSDTLSDVIGAAEETDKITSLFLRTMPVLFDWLDCSGRSKDAAATTFYLAQITSSLQAFLLSRPGSAVTFLVPFSESLLFEGESTSSNSSRLKSALQVDLLSRFTEELDNSERKPSLPSFFKISLSSVLKSRMPFLQERFDMLSKNVLEKDIPESSRIAWLSMNSLALEKVIKVLCYFVKLESGDRDSEIASTLLESQIIISISLLLKHSANSEESNSLTLSCSHFFLIASIFQPSLSCFIGRVQSIKLWFASERCQILAPADFILNLLLEGTSQERKLSPKQRMEAIQASSDHLEILQDTQLHRALEKLYIWNVIQLPNKQIATLLAFQKALKRLVRVQHDPLDKTSKKATHSRCKFLLKVLLEPNAASKND